MNKDALIASLQATIASLLKQLEIQSIQLATQLGQLESLQQQIDTFQRMLFGAKSEKRVSDNDHTPSDKSSVTTDGVFESARKPKRRRLPETLERIIIENDFSESEKASCSQCHQKKRRIGKKITEQLELVPAQLVVMQHVRYQYKCGCGLCIATMPNQPVDKGLPGPGLLADVLLSKYQDATPLYRQMLRFRRLGYDCPDSTLGDWVKQSALSLEPIVLAMRRDLLLAKKLHTDDTPVPVLAKGRTKTGRLWVYLSDHNNPHAICLYDYTSTRSQKGPMNYLKNYTGFLQADAYSGYDCLYETERIIEVGCMAHVRRKFFDVAKAAKGPSYAADIIDIIKHLYFIERQVKLMSEPERYYYRKKHSKPILRQLYRNINQHFRKATPGTPFYKALQYAKNQQVALCRYLANAKLDIDNNKAERAIKPLVIGRKNWLFAGSDNGGKRAAIIYSIIETCKMNNINPLKYLTDVLAKLPNTLNKDLQMLLPYNWKP